ncbi:hypothetical protein [Fretibacter rubidus]
MRCHSGTHAFRPAKRDFNTVKSMMLSKLKRMSRKTQSRLPKASEAN